MASDWPLLTGGHYSKVVVRTGLTVYLKWPVTLPILFFPKHPSILPFHPSQDCELRQFKKQEWYQKSTVNKYYYWGNPASLSASLFLYLSVSLSLCLSLLLSLFVSLYLSLFICLSLSVSLYLSLFICLSLYLSLYISLSAKVSMIRYSFLLRGWHIFGWTTTFI
jgi:hypothetical protein